MLFHSSNFVLYNLFLIAILLTIIYSLRLVYFTVMRPISRSLTFLGVFDNEKSFNFVRLVLLFLRVFSGGFVTLTMSQDPLFVLIFRESKVFIAELVFILFIPLGWVFVKRKIEFFIFEFSRILGLPLIISFPRGLAGCARAIVFLVRDKSK